MLFKYVRNWNIKVAVSVCILLIASTTALLHAQSRSDEAGNDKADQKSSTSSRNDAKSDDPEPRRTPSASDILKELQKESRREAKVITRATRFGGQRRRVHANVPRGNAIQPAEAKLLPDGSRIVDRPGRLTREGDYFTFSFESRGQGAPELPMRLLPNRLLEDMEVFSSGGAEPIVFVVSGEITEYRGVNYLLIQKLLVRPSLGNLK